MSAQLACPHCKAVLPPGPPGVLYCGKCGKAYAIPNENDLAVLAKKRSDEKNILMLVGGAVFVVYVLPVLLTMGYACFMIGIWFVIAIGVGVGSAVS